MFMTMILSLSQLSGLKSDCHCDSDSHNDQNGRASHCAYDLRSR